MFQKIWDSGIGLSSWLIGLDNGSQPADGILATLKDALFSVQKRNILELGMVSRPVVMFAEGAPVGTGTGIVSLTLAAIISAKNIFPATPGHIITTDLGMWPSIYLQGLHLIIQTTRIRDASA
jgi:protein N-lysine methyltransferase METTL21D